MTPSTMPEDTPPHGIGASVPRSGHSFLRRCLLAYFGRGGMAFCAPGGRHECCGVIPCRQAGGASFFYQKNHDFTLGLDHARQAPWLFYLVQYRHPLPQILSYTEFAEDKRGSPQPEAVHLRWLARQVRYLKGFSEKWVGTGRPDIIELRYEDLIADPETHLGAVIARAAGTVDAPRLREAIAKVSGFRRRTEPYRPRDIAASRHFDPALHGAFEALALAEAPRLAYAPILGHGAPDPEHPLTRAYRAIGEEHR